LSGATAELEGQGADVDATATDEPADSGARQLNGVASDPDQGNLYDDKVPEPGHDEVADTVVAGARKRRSRGVSATAAAILTGVVATLAVGGVVGWQGYRTVQSQQVQAQRAVFLQASRQAALNLTTIDYTDADADIQRILDSATGVFHDDFQQRAKPFVDVVKQAQSKSEGSVTEAALESQTGDQAYVLVAVSVKTSIGTAPQQEQQPRAWRMRIGVQRVGGDAKVSDVQFVP
jgi:Mce-associated membrane protein